MEIEKLVLFPTPEGLNSLIFLSHELNKELDVAYSQYIQCMERCKDTPDSVSSHPSAYKVKLHVVVLTANEEKEV